MFGKLFGRASDASEGTKTRTVYHWSCECGSHCRCSENSGEGWLFEPDAEYNATRHKDYQGNDHPIPKVYSEGVQVPADWP